MRLDNRIEILYTTFMQITKQWLKQKYIDEKLSTIKVGKLAKLSNARISQLLMKYNIPRRRNKIWKAGHVGSYKTGSTIIRGRAYLWISNYGYIKRSRYNMETKLNRKLKSTELVHHIDGNPLNDDISNLVITNRQKHIRENHCKYKDARNKYIKLRKIYNDIESRQTLKNEFIKKMNLKTSYEKEKVVGALYQVAKRLNFGNIK